jgi:hypothetical protein
MVEHLTLYHNLKGSNPAAGAGREKIIKRGYLKLKEIIIIIVFFN